MGISALLNGIFVAIITLENIDAGNFHIRSRDDVHFNDLRDSIKCARMCPSIVCEFGVSIEGLR